MHNYKNTCSKEANLMPVPSPQQIQFPLLDGQELTIQKQPNTSLRDSDLVSPSVGGDPSTPTPSDTKGPGTPGPGQAPPAPQTPSSQHGEAPPKYPGGPNTPTSESGLYPGDGPATPHTPSSQDKNSRFPAPSPSPADPRFPVPAASPSQTRLPGGMSPSHMAMGPDNTSNMPLNPGTPGSSQSTNTNMSNKGFDPISSMAQMSQQLAGAATTPCSTPNSIGPGPDSGLGSMGNLEPGMLNSPLGGSMLGPDGNPVFSSSGMTPGHDSSPTNMDSAGGPMGMRPNGPGQMMGPRGPMMGPGPGGPMGPGPGGPMGMGPGPGPGPGMMGPGGPMSNNCSMPSSSASCGGTFTTVKASAPNTIQYLPSRPPNSQGGPRGPPSLDFLQRFANPNMDKNMGPNGPGPM